MKLSLSLAIVFLCSVSAAASDLERVIESSVAQHQKVLQTGYAIAVIQNGRPDLYRYFGLADRDTKAPIDNSTVFNIASISKSFTAFNFLRMSYDGKVQLDKPLEDNESFMDFSLLDKDAAKQINLIDLLAHRTGVPANDSLWYFAPFGRVELTGKLQYLQPRPSAGFRKSFEYNNMMYAAASVLGERVSGESWEESIQKYIFNPLEMNDAFSDQFKAWQSGQLAKNYYRDKPMGYYQYMKNIAAAGGLHMDLPDLAKWAKFHLAGGVTENGERLLPVTEMEKLYEPRIAIDESRKLFYGLGWVIDESRPFRVLSHTGGIDGFTSVILLIPEKNIGVIVLTNHHKERSILEISKDIVSHLIQEEVSGIELSFLRNSLSREKYKDTGKLTGVSKLASAELIGTYKHPAYGTLTITNREGKAYLRYFNIDSELLFSKADEYIVRFVDYAENIEMPIKLNRNNKSKLSSISFPIHYEDEIPLDFTKRQN